MEWECSEGHRWLATPDSIKNTGRWCPICGGSAPLTLKEIQLIAKERGGKCLSEEYINVKTTMRWECSEGHHWENTAGKIRQGQWCPYCAGKAKLDIQDLKRLAEEKGGKCLSEKYKNNSSKLLWQCSEGHEWKSSANNIKNGAWCPFCANRARITIESLSDIANKRGGELLSTDIGNNKTKLQWRCKYGHTWKATPNAISRGTWCPKCSEGLGERVCRYFFETLFAKKFNKAHPDWLVSERGALLELDGYNERLKIAFEHQGVQHYKFLKVFHSSNEDFIDQQNRDELKKEVCKKRGIHLIEVPEIPALLPLDKVKDFIIEKLQDLQIPFKYEKAISIDLNIAYSSSKTEEFYIRLQKAVEEKGGILISNRYLGTSTKLKFKCKEGHIWKTSPNMIFNGQWCPECAGNIKYTLEQVQDFAKERGGKCLSTEYNRANEKLKWKCNFGHTWEASLSNVITANHWCPVCRKIEEETRFYNEAVDLAKKNQGTCISRKYINAKTKLKWRCSSGHEWEALLGNIRQGTWCPYCAKKRRNSNTDNLS